MEQYPQIGDRITDNSAAPDDNTVRDWIGPEAFGHWAELRNWIEAYYPGVFAPDWLCGGKKRGWSLRYKKSKAFCTFLPEYRLFSVVVVLGEQSERSLRRGVMAGARNWSSSTMKPKHTLTGNG